MAQVIRYKGVLYQRVDINRTIETYENQALKEISKLKNIANEVKQITSHPDALQDDASLHFLKNLPKELEGICSTLTALSGKLRHIG